MQPYTPVIFGKNYSVVFDDYSGWFHIRCGCKIMNVNHEEN